MYCQNSAARTALLGACALSALMCGASPTLAAKPAILDAQKGAYLHSHMINPAKLKLSTEPPATLQRQMARTHPEILRRLAAARQASLHPSLGGGPVTIPYWTGNVTSPLDHQNYTYSMVGSSPYDPNPHNTNVQYVPILLRIHLQGFTIDPSQPTPSYDNPNPNVTTCDAQSPGRRFFNSPMFRPVTNLTSNGVNVAATPGGQQLISAFQRANFWQAVHGTNYGVTLTPSRLDPIVVDWYPTDPNDSIQGAPDNCGGLVALPLLSINEVDTELQSIGATYATATQIPMTLVADSLIYVYENPGYCCVLGYHSAVPNGVNGVQVYSIGAYFDSDQVFGPGNHFNDITVWAHELGELMDDPFVQSISSVPGGGANALTPAWGHSGQVGGCQNNLETGDPLTPDQAGSFVNYPVPGVGGKVYHSQDLAFHDWFYRTPSTSTGGKYSLFGNFTNVQGACF